MGQAKFPVSLLVSLCLSSASLCAQVAIQSSSSMTQTINQSQYPPSASTTFVPNNLDYVLYADQFAVGSDIGAQVNAAIASVPCSSSGSQSIVIKLPANQFLTQTT